LQSARFDGLARGLLDHIQRRLSRAHMPAPDARTRADPLVVRVHELFEIIIFNNRRRIVRAEARDRYIHCATPTPRYLR
jgi:hypothetical protein